MPKGTIRASCLPALIFERCACCELRPLAEHCHSFGCGLRFVAFLMCTIGTDMSGRCCCAPARRTLIWRRRAQALCRAAVMRAPDPAAGGPAEDPSNSIAGALSAFLKLLFTRLNTAWHLTGTSCLNYNNAAGGSAVAAGAASGLASTPIRPTSARTGGERSEDAKVGLRSGTQLQWLQRVSSNRRIVGQ